MTPLEELADAVILNNSPAVQGNIAELGVLQPNLPAMNDADVKAALWHGWEHSGSQEDALAYLGKALDVNPIVGNPGYEVIERFDAISDNGIEGVQSPQNPNPVKSEDTIHLSFSTSPMKLMKLLGLIVLILLIIKLLKSITHVG